MHLCFQHPLAQAGSFTFWFQMSDTLPLLSGYRKALCPCSRHSVITTGRSSLTWKGTNLLAQTKHWPATSLHQAAVCFLSPHPTNRGRDPPYGCHGKNELPVQGRGTAPHNELTGD